MQRINPSLLSQASPFAEKLPSILKERAGKMIDKLMRAVIEAKKVKNNHRIGPGRVTVFTHAKYVQKMIASKKPYNRYRHGAGGYINREAADRATKRFIRWMAANPKAVDGRGMPRHIARNAAMASRAAR